MKWWFRLDGFLTVFIRRVTTIEFCELQLYTEPLPFSRCFFFSVPFVGVERVYFYKWFVDDRSIAEDGKELFGPITGRGLVSVLNLLLVTSVHIQPERMENQKRRWKSWLRCCHSHPYLFVGLAIYLVVLIHLN